MTLPSPQAIIFDWDNTLVNTWPIIHAALEATFREMGKEPWTFQQTTERVRKSMRDSFPEIFGKGWQRAGELYQRHYRRHHLDRLEALPGAEELLAHLRTRSLPNLVVSNKKGPNLRQEIAHLGWEKFFDSVVGADDAARDKPFADPVELALARIGLKPSAGIWFIGDSEIDLECAKNTGCTAILYGRHARSHPTYNATHYLGFAYHAHVDNHQEMMALLHAAQPRGAVDKSA